jgi:hypothetical protein
LVETETKHRKLNNYGLGGMLISLTFCTWFVAIDYWYGGNKLVIGKQVLRFKKRYEKFYDSYKLFEKMSSKKTSTAGVSGAGDSGAPGEADAGRDDEYEYIEQNEVLRHADELIKSIELEAILRNSPAPH